MTRTSKGAFTPLVFMCRKCEGKMSIPISEIMSPNDILDLFRELEEKPCPHCGEEEDGLWRFFYVGY